METIIIGITGASSSGKSTVCRALCELLPEAMLVQQDFYFKAEKDCPYDETRHAYDWDCIEALDMPRMTADLAIIKQGGTTESCTSAMTNFKPDTDFVLSQKAIADLEQKLKPLQAYRIILVDGFLLLRENIIELFDCTLFVSADYFTLKQRREGRIYFVDGEPWENPEGYFDDFVWPGYLEYHQSLFTEKSTDMIKKTGGTLLEDFCSTKNVHQFVNSNETKFDQLVLSIVDCITQLGQ